MALHPKVIDLTLDRVWRLLRALGNPQDRLPSVIHLAGTNGKGSTQAMIRSGLEGAGRTVHAYTSPHLAKFHERIRIAGELISEAALTELLDRCYSANGGETITYFEITTCAALQGFAEHAADYTLLETGMGGRLDVTNVVDKPAACVLTPIDLDHQQFLGDTLAKIAFEKAGILKRGVTAIVGPQPEEALEVIERQAAKIGADLRIHGQHWHVTTEAGRLVYQDETGLLDLPLPCLPGPHQIQNAGAAIATLRHLGQGEDACTAAMLQAYWPARMQRLRQGRLIDSLPGHEIWLDGGHNPAAGRAIAATLATLPKRDTHIICGMLNTKDVTGFLAPIAAHCASLTTVTIPNEINAVSSADLAEVGRSCAIPSREASDVHAALQDLSQSHPQARILICGSLACATGIERLWHGRGRGDKPNLRFIDRINERNKAFGLAGICAPEQWDIIEHQNLGLSYQSEIIRRPQGGTTELCKRHSGNSIAKFWNHHPAGFHLKGKGLPRPPGQIHPDLIHTSPRSRVVGRKITALPRHPVLAIIRRRGQLMHHHFLLQQRDEGQKKLPV